MSPPLVVLAGLIATAVLVPALIAAQRRSRLGQHVYEDGPKTHAPKSGTPTMGGLAFGLAALIGFVMGGADEQALPLLLLVLCAGGIGLVDDILILRARRALGLRARVKFAALTIVAAAYVAYVARQGFAGPEQSWFGSSVLLSPGWWAVLAVLAIVGAANAVNLTDGLDGLAAGTCVPTLVAVQLTARYQGDIAVIGIGDGVLGSLLGFLWFNRHPARIFMGDTGSLALGALVAGIAIQSHALLLLPLFGLVFVLEALSVIAQVASFKTTRRRIFKMSPLHHHFELSGWRETQVTSAFVAFAAIAAAVTWVGWWSTSVRAVQPL